MSFFFQAEDGIRDIGVTGVQTCALPICYLESVSPYARRLFNQMSVPEVDEVEGLPPAVALQQQRGSPSTRSSVGSVTTLRSEERRVGKECRSRWSPYH